jgi:tetratricopeptide (TPR) repeat protein
MPDVAESAPMNLRPWEKVPPAPAVDRVRSMLSDQEKRYLTWLASEKYEGWGAIVELGVWLGSSSAALAEGLRRNGRTDKIYSFDRFVWEDYMAAVASEDLKPGDDFLPLYLREIGEYRPWIEARKIDLLDYSWTGGPIEILFVDSAKTWDLTNAILKGFGPYLVPERSRVVLQDFRFPYAHCLPLIFDSRPDVWKQVEDIADSHTVTFMPLRPLFGRGGIQADYSEESFPLASAGHLLRNRIAREGGPIGRSLFGSLYRKYLIDGPLDEARKIRQQVLAAGIAESDLRAAEDPGILASRGWSAYQAGNYQAAREAAERWLSISNRKNVNTLTVLAFSCLRLGDRNSAEQAMKELRAIDPAYAPGKLFRAELAIRDRCYELAETEVLEVLKAQPRDETTIRWALNLLTQAWNLKSPGSARPRILRELADSLGQSPSLLEWLRQNN